MTVASLVSLLLACSVPGGLRHLRVRLRLDGPGEVPRVGAAGAARPLSGALDDTDGTVPPGPSPSGPAGVAVVADLIAVALAAGRGVPAALSDAASVLRPRWPGSPVVRAAAALERGLPTGDALEQLATEPGWHPLATQLAISAQAGTPAAVALRQLAAQERLRARRERERRARRLPVLLLLPLVAMVLPAFVLVTVVPYLAAGGLDLGFDIGAEPVLPPYGEGAGQPPMGGD
ncbi:MAG: type II secretion system F family protein [Microthrixaceae bacterium]|nr:type II secretion system F family protein [Microthrixaceae bacterium]